MRDIDMEQSSPQEQRPNILIIMTDQQNVDAISAYQDSFSHSAYGPHWLDTPNLDRLARRGVSFLESHTPNPVCSPSRSCFFTGRYATETGVTRNGVGIDRNVPNMGQWFERHSDYERVYCGKWHAGGKWVYPTLSGVCEIPGFDIIPVGSLGLGVFADDQVSSSIAGYIRNYNDERPFLAVAGLMNPHDICFWAGPGLGSKYMVPSADIFELKEQLPALPPNCAYDFAEPREMGTKESFSDMQWRNYAYDYYRLVEKIDTHVGRILRATENRDDDTMVILTSDHGEGLGRHHRVGKWHPYEPSLKVPLIVSLPGHIQESVTDTTHLVNSVDVMPTVCDYAGIPMPPHARGQSLRPLLEGKRTDHWRDHVFSEIQHTGRMIRTDQFKYVKFYQYSGKPDQPFIRTSDGSATRFEPGKSETYEEEPTKLLFDLKNDPWEKRNLYDDPSYTEVMEEHDRMLREEYEDVLIPGIHYDRNGRC